MRAGRRPLAFAAAAALVMVVLAWGELEHWRSSRRELGRDSGTAGSSEAIVVLGFRNRGTRANTINRWRVRAALRSRQPELGPSRLVLCGGPVGGPVPEAELIASTPATSAGTPAC